jgi:hypothetical protein
MSKTASCVRFRLHPLRDEKTSLTRCTNTSIRMAHFSASLYYTVLVVLERVNSLSNSYKNPKPTSCIVIHDFCLTICDLFFRFSDIFYIDATNEQSLEIDLKAIGPGNVERSVDENLRWLANQHEGRWLLFFDNADDIQLKLNKFFPPCAFGNILVTTRNQELRLYAAKGSAQNVASMDHDDATKLLLHLSQEEETDENKRLSAEIVQVILGHL